MAKESKLLFLRESHIGQYRYFLVVVATTTFKPSSRRNFRNLRLPKLEEEVLLYIHKTSFDLIGTYANFKKSSNYSYRIKSS